MSPLLLTQYISTINSLLITVQESLALLQKADLTDEELQALIDANISKMQALRDND